VDLGRTSRCRRGPDTRTARDWVIEPWFVNTPRSLWLTRTVFFAIAAASRQGAMCDTGRTPSCSGRRRDRAVATYATTSMPALTGGALGYVLYPFRLLLSHRARNGAGRARGACFSLAPGRDLDRESLTVNGRSGAGPAWKLLLNLIARLPQPH